MNFYRLRMRHDEGIVNLIIGADRLTSAVRRLLKLEGAPFCAILGIQRKAIGRRGWVQLAGK